MFKFIPFVTAKYKSVPKIYLLPWILANLAKITFGDLFFFWKLLLAKCTTLNFLIGFEKRVWFSAYSFLNDLFLFSVIKYWQKVLLSFLCHYKTCFSINLLLSVFGGRVNSWCHSPFRCFEIVVISLNTTVSFFFFTVDVFHIYSL